ncbi:MAG: PAS domain-containing protein [Acidobacteriales bacterium]|nr:PAS domain-containing protein [Terriglobales bacterium]
MLKGRFASTTAGLAVGVTAAAVLACAGGAWLYSRQHMASLLETARRTATAEGDLIRVALEHQMVENDRTLIARMIESFRRQAGVDRLMLLDRYGRQRYPSSLAEQDNELRIDSPTCQACHRHPAEQRESSRIIETAGGSVLRTVVPIRNRPECHKCHDPNHKINGILILDYNAGELHAAMNRDLRWLVAGTGLITLLLVGAIAIVIRLAVLRRLQRFETTARQIAAGDLGRRVPSAGSDTISWLAREFNTMADAVTGLVGEVRTERERLETVINSIDDGIVVLDPDRQIIAANDAFLLRARHVREEVLGCACSNVMSGGCNLNECPTLACLKSGERQVRICERRKPDGSVAWEEIHASPVRDASGKLLLVVEVWRDISERLAAEAHLADSHRLASLGTLASGFSHELNTPLATVLTCIEGILRDLSQDSNIEPDAGRIRESASVAREQILRCRGITQHFLRISRGQRTQGDILDMETTVTSVARLIEPTARANAVRIDVRPIAPGLHVRADEAELQQALINLLLNAIQACKAGGKVLVEVEPNDAVHLRISDDGCGIPADVRKRIFEPFFSTRQGGTGLGLFLSINFVRRWGGDIHVESAPGRGSCFEVTLPMAAKAANLGVTP